MEFREKIDGASIVVYAIKEGILHAKIDLFSFTK